MNWLRARCAALTLGVCLLHATHAAAEQRTEGVVVRVDDGEVIVDLGQHVGLAPEAELRVFRRVVIKHPVTGEELVDRFPIGRVPVAEVGELLSIVRDVSGLSRPARLGDYVVLPGDAPPRRPLPAAPELDPETKAINAALEWSLGQPLDQQITVWQATLDRFAEGQHAERVARHLRQLRELLADTRAEPTPATPTPLTEPAQLTVRHAKLKRITRGELAPIAIAVVETDLVDRVRLVARRRGSRRWETVELARDGDFYFRGAMPAELVSRAGEVQYFVEVVRTNADLEPAVGRAGEPARLRVDERPAGERGPGASRVDLESRYVDFNTGGPTDAWWEFEASFTYGVDWYFVRAIKVGVGHIDGEGARVDDLGDAEAARSIALNYAFAEAEIGMGPWVGLAGRVIGGTHHATADGTQASLAGAEARLRIGRAESTRLVLGGALLGEVGRQAFADMHIEVFDRVPLKTSVIVTNLPVDADLGVRLSGVGGYRITDWLTINLEAGWNARTIDHHGFTAGGGLSLAW